MTRPHPDLLALKSATKALVDACGGSEICGKVLGKSASLVRAYGNPNALDRFMPLDDVVVLERTAARPIVSAWMAERAKADADRPRRRACVSDLATWVKEGAEAKVAYAALFATPGACPSPNDRARAVKELRELETLLADLREAVEEGE